MIRSRVALLSNGLTEHGEIKSMRTPRHLRRRGAARLLLTHLIDKAQQQGYRQLSLETGSMAFFKPARALYTSLGFTPCGPFGDYADDPNSVFMTLRFDATESTYRSTD